MSAKLSLVPPMDEEAMAEAQQRFREKMMRDTEQVWNELVALARFGYDETVKLQAARLALSYTLGVPTERVEVTQRPQRRTALNYDQLSQEEIQALALLREGRRRRALESGEDEE